MLEFIKLYKWPIGLAGFLLYTVLMLFSGWQIHTYYVGYQENQAAQVQKIVKDGISEFQKNQAQGLADTLGLLDKAKVNVTTKEKTIINQPIYLEKCMDQPGVDLLKDYKEASAEIINGKKK